MLIELPPRLGVFAPDLVRRLAFPGGGEVNQLVDRDVAVADGFPNDAFGLCASRFWRESINHLGAKCAKLMILHRLGRSDPIVGVMPPRHSRPLHRPESFSRHVIHQNTHHTRVTRPRRAATRPTREKHKPHGMDGLQLREGD